MKIMKSEKIIALVKGVWAFCSFLFVPQWGRNRNAKKLLRQEIEK